jgi:hypothetical protein
VEGNNFVITKGLRPLRTPMGKTVTTTYKALADRLVEDLRNYGEDPSSTCSLVSFHYPMIDFFATTPRQQLEASVAMGLEPQYDWTFQCPSAAPEPTLRWMALFGRPKGEEGKKWLASLTLTQLCAVCVLGRSIESVNIPFILATVLPPKEIRAYAQQVAECYGAASAADLVKWFENYLFYFNLEEDKR